MFLGLVAPIQAIFLYLGQKFAWFLFACKERASSGRVDRLSTWFLPGRFYARLSEYWVNKNGIYSHASWLSSPENLEQIGIHLSFS
jgi:hypothetical protein